MVPFYIPCLLQSLARDVYYAGLYSQIGVDSDILIDEQFERMRRKAGAPPLLAPHPPHAPHLLPPPPGLPSRAAGKSMNERLPSLPKR